jgi:hypothetical protein
MARSLRTVGVMAAGLLAGACASAPPVVENTTRGPKAAEMHIVRSFNANGREPGWDEKRQFEDQLEERVFKYLREHPEIESDTRYSSFRFWRQVTIGSTKEEVRILLEEPDQRTIDPALMASSPGGTGRRSSPRPRRRGSTRLAGSSTWMTRPWSA